MEWREADGVRWLEAELPGARAAFTTRLGGFSEGPFESLNVGIQTGDDRGRVQRNRHRLAHGLGLDPGAVLAARQVHGAELERHEDPLDPSPWAEAEPAPSQADAQATSTPGLAPLVMVADCLPIALAGPGGVAMAHGGWRGLAAGVVERAAREVDATAAAIGPGIGPCCYEVGEEVLEALGDAASGAASGRMLDLGAIARAQLRRAGVKEVSSAGLCTSCEPTLFFSHRRDRGRTGRQAGLAWLA